MYTHVRSIIEVVIQCIYMYGSIIEVVIQCIYMYGLS